MHIRNTRTLYSKYSPQFTPVNQWQCHTRGKSRRVKQRAQQELVTLVRTPRGLQCHDNTGSWIESLPPGGVQLVQNSVLQSVQVRSSPILNLISSVLSVQVLSRFRWNKQSIVTGHFELTFVKLVTDDKGDFMLLQLKINDQTFTLVNFHSLNNILKLTQIFTIASWEN